MINNNQVTHECIQVGDDRTEDFDQNIGEEIRFKNVLSSNLALHQVKFSWKLI